MALYWSPTPQQCNHSTTKPCDRSAGTKKTPFGWHDIGTVQPVTQKHVMSQHFSWTGAQLHSKSRSVQEKKPASIRKHNSHQPHQQPRRYWMRMLPQMEFSYRSAHPHQQLRKCWVCATTNGAQRTRAHPHQQLRRYWECMPSQPRDESTKTPTLKPAAHR